MLVQEANLAIVMPLDQDLRTLTLATSRRLRLALRYIFRVVSITVLAPRASYVLLIDYYVLWGCTLLLLYCSPHLGRVWLAGWCWPGAAVD